MTIHDVKIKYVADAFKLCGYSIKYTHIATGLHPETLKRYLNMANIDHKTPVVPAAAVEITRWKKTELDYIMATFRKFDYCQVETQIALGMSENGLAYKLKKIGFPSCARLCTVTKAQVLESSKEFDNIHDWFEAEPAMVKAAHRLNAVKGLKW